MRTFKLPKIELWIALGAFFAMGVYLLASYLRVGVVGFPLDDAWIHQTYARNLARLGEWSFIPGVKSGGSTSPFCSMLISIGYLFSKDALFWSFFLGWVSLSITGILGERVFRVETSKIRMRLPLAGIFLVFEWHLVWAAVSGMETILYAALIVLIYWMMVKSAKSWGVIGLAVGAAVWVRPDAVTLLGPVLFACCLSSSLRKERILSGVKIVGSFLIVFLPYLLFNALISGSAWPNTFYAKQAEYAVLLDTPLLARVFQMTSLPMIGAGILLLPGVLYFAWTGWQRRNWAGIGMLIWWFGYDLLYALRLPVTYQHGRYLMPAMPVYFIAGLAGYLSYINSHRAPSRKRFILQTSWTMGIAVTLGLFFALGASSYANDVGIIETEMVQTARWVDRNLPENAVVAAHDIGALGFFGNRPLVDLAGLISPEVIPFIRDEERLAGYLFQKNVDYLVTFPGWYPTLVQYGEAVYSTGAKFSPLMGGENMTVYQLKDHLFLYSNY